MAESNRAMLTSVARMYYLDGLGQSEIASILGVSRSTVSRLLTAAREHGVVRISVDDYDPRDTHLEQDLIDRFGLKRAVVVRSLDGQPGNARRTTYPVLFAMRRGVASACSACHASWLCAEHP